MNNNTHLSDLKEIRSIMDRSTRFLSLSGLAGILAGVFALIGGFVAYVYLGKLGLITDTFQSYSHYLPVSTLPEPAEIISFIFLDAGLVLLFAIIAGLYFGLRKSKKDGIPFWSPASRRLLWNLAIPLVAGGIFCAILYYHYVFWLIAPSTLIFYGMALLNAGKYTLNEIRYLGISEIVLGLISAFYISYGLLFWMIGFGILHIVYGAIMYFKYER